MRGEKDLRPLGGVLVGVGRGAERLAETARRIGEETNRAGAVRAHAADVTDEDQVNGAVTSAVEHDGGLNGGLNGVVACAGGSETIGTITQKDDLKCPSRADRGPTHVVGSSARRQEGTDCIA